MGEVADVACMAHIRCKFVDIFWAIGSAFAEEVIGRIAGLYEIEAQARGQPQDERVRLGKDHAGPLFEDLQQ